MILKEIRINGFKSFADTTVIQLHEGVTAVVGPNGCGKSNISDAIRWVLGEQSAKALRGTRMQDVIFQGTEKRKQHNICDVSLLFTDCEEQLGTAFAEVEVRRRVSRDGQGEYYLNGQHCRLRDIHQLFMDTGVGRESYSFMAQGQISKIVDANPAGRRSLFEEAAGISKYKSQRKEALNKLERVDQNLQRVSDKLDMLTRRMSSVKRQASKTLRYKRLKHRLTHLDLASIRFKHSGFVEAISTLEQNAGGLRSDVESLKETVSEGEIGLESSRTSRAEFFEKVKYSQEKVFDLRNEKDQAESRAEFALTRCEDLNERIAEINGELGDLSTQLEELGSKASSSAALRLQHEEQMSTSDSAYEERVSEVDAVQKQLVGKENEIRTLKQDMIGKENTITRLRSNCTSMEVDLKTSESRQENLEEQLLQFKTEAQNKDKEAEELSTSISQTETNIQAAEEDSNKARSAVEEFNGKFRELQMQIQESDRIVAKLTASLSLLEDLQSKFEGFSDGAKAILQGKLKDVLGDITAAPLSNSIIVEDEYTNRFETLLGNGAEAILLGDPKLAAATSAHLRDNSLGQAALLIELPGKNKGNTSSHPEFLKPAAQAVSAKEDTLNATLESLLSGCYFGTTLDAFLDFWKDNPDFDFQLVITESNEVIDRRGLVFAGNKGSKGRESSLIQREAEIRKLKENATTENDKLTTLNEDALQLQLELEKAESTLESTQKEVVQLGQKLSSLQAAEQSVKAATETFAQHISRTEGEIEKISSQRNEAQSNLDSARSELEEAEGILTHHRETIASDEQSIEQLRQEREKLQQRLNDVRVDRAEKQRLLDMLTQGLDNIEAQKQDIDHRILRRKKDIDAIHAQTDDLKDEANKEKSRALEIDRDLEKTTLELKTHNEALQKVEATIRETESGLSEYRTSLHEKESRLNKLEIDLTKNKSQLEFLHEKAETEYAIELHQIDWKAELWKANEEFETRINLDELEDEDHETPKVKNERGEPTEDDLAAMDNLDWDELDREINTLRSRIQAMGEINPAAIEEYTETKEEYEFLKTQSDDLWNAKEELIKAIDEINETSKRLFEETFDKVRENFKKCFKQLNGGKADLNLVEAEDVLESGIEIMAQPVGTKLQTLSLLSGGQKTMTACALLFAIYMVKPSPFCVLDELDAPLDDANIGRFTDMLSSFLEYSQFLIITHNKRTLNVANTLYGVTMQEPGVTRLVSLRFSKDGEAQFSEGEGDKKGITEEMTAGASS